MAQYGMKQFLQKINAVL